MMSLNINNLRFYWVVLLLLKKTFKYFRWKGNVYVPLRWNSKRYIGYFCTAIDIFEKYTNTNE